MPHFSAPHDSGNRAPIDSRAAPEGAGSFKPSGHVGRNDHPHSLPIQSSPAGRRSIAKTISALSAVRRIERAAIIDQLSDLFISDGQRKGFEGLKNYLYADSAGHVTIGVGHLVAHKIASDSEVKIALAAIPLVHSKPPLSTCSGPAHEEHKFTAYKEVRGRYEAKFNFVMQQGVQAAISGNENPFNADSPATAKAILDGYGINPNSNKNKLGASAYSKATVPNLPDAPTNSDLILSLDNIRALLKADLERKYSEALGHFPELLSYPARIQLVVVDILFNGTGIGGKGGWGRFKNAIKASRWEDAVRDCGAGIDVDRDKWRRSQLELESLQRRMDLYNGLYIG